ncbi:MAG: ribosome biogenesis GTPase Der, partial [Clostridia bacterium]|nr:ribosome biogenesis GTPase Der [Clostridia bacterium]
PGVTRDRIFGECEWLGHKMMLVDTGGIEPYSDDIILSQMRRQAQLAIDSANVIIFVTDVRDGVVATDSEVASMLQKSGKPIVLCVNKCDKIGEPPADIYEFYNLGIGDPFPVSSVHGHGTGDLLDEVIKHFPEEYLRDGEDEDDYIKVAVIGKPNVGKSSLVNKIIGEDRMIVSDIAGTTRDATDSFVENDYGKFMFIDTAGLRRKSKVEDAVERYSVLRTDMAVERANVCVIMIDALEGFTEQDSKVAGRALEQGKGYIIAVNKWDAYEKDGKTMDSYRKKLMNDFSFMSFAPIIFISAKTGQRLDRLYELIKFVDTQNAMRVKTGQLNEILAAATLRVQPPTDKGKRLKIYYMTQASTRPPTFVCFVNNAELFHYSYQRYLENQIREVYGLEGTPVRFVIRERGDKKF